jgi:uncharacterized membrane protein
VIRRLYRKVRRWVDRELDTVARGFMIPLFAAAGVGIVAARELSGWAEWIAVGAVAASAAAWIGFVAWRAWRLMRASGLRGDRDYDRRIKHDLPPEYADTESATAARRRRRR